MKISAATVFTILALMLIGAGGAYGLAPVNVGASCGSAFNKATSPTLSDTGLEACASERSNRQAVSFALFAAGGVAILCAVMLAIDASGKRKAAEAAAIVEQA